MKGKSIAVDAKGNIRHKKKNIFKNKRDHKTIELKRHSRKHLNNTTRSESHEQFAFTHGARIMKNTSKWKDMESPYDSTEISEKPSVNYPRDKHCHPSIRK